MPVRTNADGGGGVRSDDITITRAMLPQGYTGLTKDSDDEIVAGENPVIGAQDIVLPINGSIAISKGVHNGSGRARQSIPTLGAQTITPQTWQQVVSSSGKYVTGNVTINPIPANYLNIEAGQVVFRDGAFGRIVNKGWGFGFWRSYGNQKMLLNATEYINLGYEGPARAPKIEPNGLFFSVASNGTCDLILNGSIDLTRFSSITITYFTDSVPNTTPRMILQAVSANEQVCTQKYQSIYVGTSQLSLDISALKGHHYILMRISYGGPGGARCHVSSITLNP